MTDPGPDHVEAPVRDSDAAVDFLRKWSPGPWALSAIDPKSRDIRGALFRSNEEGKLRLWLDEKGDAGQNIYFSVNEVIASMFKTKAGREGIERVTHFHVDIDPRAGEDLDLERQRIKKLVETPPQGVPKPTCAVFSGGGYQLFWALEQPIEIGGNIAKAEAAKLYNLQIEFLYHGDNCHDVSRIMRLPGTINVPDKKKIAKGRTKQLAKEIYFYEDLSCPESAFTAATVPDNSTASNRAARATIDIGPIVRAKSIDEMVAWCVARGGVLSDKTQLLIAHGDDPDDPTTYGGDRSDALFAAMRGMEKAKLSDTEMYSLITDETWGISKSVLDKGSDIERYAKRQIARIREKSNALLDAYDKLIYVEGCTVVRNKNKTGVYCRPQDKSIEDSFQSFSAFKDYYLDWQVSVPNDGEGGGTTKVSVAPSWLKWNGKPKEPCFGFWPNREPGRSGGEGYNLWEGFAVEPIAGDCSLILDHIEFVCGGDKVLSEYVLNWMANTVQHPERQGETVIVMRGDEGTGKGTTAQSLGSLFPEAHFKQISQSKHLAGNFNAHLRLCVLLFADEAFYAGNGQHEATLKALATERTMQVEAKGVDVTTGVNCVHLMMASNKDWIIPAGVNARRWCVIDVPDDHVDDFGYFKAIKEQMANGGREALLHHLLNRDLGNFNVRKVPKTKALQDLKEMTLAGLDLWLFNLAREGKLGPKVLVSNDGAEPVYGVAAAWLIASARDEVQNRNASKIAIGKALAKAGAKRPTRKDVTSCWIIPELPELRAWWVGRGMADNCWSLAGDDDGTEPGEGAIEPKKTDWSWEHSAF